mmetsp:Transcript_134330/g.251381  ORF Transcript_134330/g.251381 Transcript_134330/m.251381 type:complete len:223 (-) Transcript_134330:779-1447(-)
MLHAAISWAAQATSPSPASNCGTALFQEGVSDENDICVVCCQTVLVTRLNKIQVWGCMVKTLKSAGHQLAIFCAMLDLVPSPVGSVPVRLLRLIFVLLSTGCQLASPFTPATFCIIRPWKVDRVPEIAGQDGPSNLWRIAIKFVISAKQVRNAFLQQHWPHLTVECCCVAWTPSCRTFSIVTVVRIAWHPIIDLDVPLPPALIWIMQRQLVRPVLASVQTFG